MKAGKSEGFLTVTTGHKVLFYKVNNLYGFIYRLNKKSISADGGVDALVEWLTKPCEWRSMQEIALLKIVDYVQPVKVLYI